MSIPQSAALTAPFTQGSLGRCQWKVVLLWLGGFLLNKGKVWGGLFGLLPAIHLLYMSTQTTGQVINIEMPLGIITALYVVACGFWVWKKVQAMKQIPIYLSNPLKTLDFTWFLSSLILNTYVFSLVFALMSKNKGKFLLFAADYLIKQPCGTTLRFPCSVSVNIHCSEYQQSSHDCLLMYFFSGGGCLSISL